MGHDALRIRRDHGEIEAQKWIGPSVGQKDDKVILEGEQCG